VLCCYYYYYRRPPGPENDKNTAGRVAVQVQASERRISTAFSGCSYGKRYVSSPVNTAGQSPLTKCDDFRTSEHFLHTSPVRVTEITRVRRFRRHTGTSRIDNRQRSLLGPETIRDALYSKRKPELATSFDDVNIANGTSAKTDYFPLCRS